MTAPGGHAKTVCRFAPSPSGRMHLGNVLSLMLAWLSARSQGAVFVVRLEDLDERCRNPQYASDLLDDIRWLGFDWDGEPFVQSASGLQRYEEAFENLERLGLVYPCFCSRADLHAASAPHASDGTFVYAGTCKGLPEEERHERARELLARTGHGPAWRMEVADEDVGFVDLVQGEQSQNLARDCGDFVVKRGDGVIAYQLAVVVDDEECGVTEVVRGRDLIGSVARQKHLQRALGYRELEYAHHPLLLSGDGRRLSKRDRDCDVGFLRQRGVRSEQIVGALAHAVGLAPTADGAKPCELVEGFSWSKVERKDLKVPPCIARWSC